MIILNFELIYVCCNLSWGACIGYHCLFLVCFFWTPWQSLIASASKNQNKAFVVDQRQSKANTAMNAKNTFKMANNIFIPSTAQLPYCIIYFVPSRSFFYIYVFLHGLIFYQPKTTFQIVENNFPDRASIFRQLTFFTFHQTYFTLQWWTGKCQCQALLKANQSTVNNWANSCTWQRNLWATCIIFPI